MFRRKINLEDIFGMYEQFMNEHPFFVKGKTKTEKGGDDQGEWVKETFTSNDGLFTVSSFTKTYFGVSEPLKPSDELSRLKSELDNAVNNEEFETAIELRDKIKSFETNAKKIKELEDTLNIKIKEEDFEEAIKLRDEIKRLKS